jgi:hypothetical protein
MGIRDRLGKSRPRKQADASDGEAMDVARYTFLLRVASSDALRQAHREAFTMLSSEQSEALFLRLAHDLPDRLRPPTAEPADLAQAAFSAELLDHGQLVRILRRPRQGVTEGHAAGSSDAQGPTLLYAHSLLAPVAAAVAVSPAVTEWLAGFSNSPEAAQVDPSHFDRSPGGGTYGSTLARHTGVAGH